MNSFNIVISLAIIAGVANAHAPAVSYVNRHDGGLYHGYHHAAPVAVIAAAPAHAVYPAHAGYAAWNPVYSAAYDHKDYYAYPKYKYEYGVKDAHTGDHKSQWEVRDGDVVKGEYTLDEADGTKRVVSYAASDKTGFNAVVKKIGHAHHYQPYAYGHSYDNGHYAPYGYHHY